MKCKKNSLWLMCPIIGLTWPVVYGQIPLGRQTIAPDTSNVQWLLERGKAYHDLGEERREKANVEKAEGYLLRVLEMDRGNAVAWVYYGSVLTMKAQIAFLPWEKMDFMKRGFALMDSAVTLAPEDPEVRLIRAINSTSVPGFFNRLKVALEDYQCIEDLVHTRQLNPPDKFWLPYYFYYGAALQQARQPEKARMQFLKVAAIDPHSPLAVRAQRELERIQECLPAAANRELEKNRQGGCPR